MSELKRPSYPKALLLAALVACGLLLPQVAYANTFAWTSHGPTAGVAQEAWRSVVYADGMFVAVGEGPTHVMTSLDGATWTPRVAAAAQLWTSITYGVGSDNVGRFVAVSLNGTKQVMTSENGVNWVLRDTPTSAWTSVTYGNGMFVAVTESGFATQNWIMTSPDGITWTVRTPPMNDNQPWASVTYGNGVFVAVTDGDRQNDNNSRLPSTHRVMYSTNGINWFYGSGAPINKWWSVTYGVGSDNIGRFVAVAYGGADRIMTSTDGQNWTIVTDPASQSASSWYAVGFGGGRFLAATFGTSQVISSTDGLTWQSETAFAGTWRSVAYGANTFVVVAEAGAGPRVERFGLVTPEAPTALTTVLGPESVTITFTAGADNGSAITNYEYSLDGGVNFIPLAPADPSSPITITGLTGGETYTILLKAVNAFDTSSPSEAVIITALGPAPTLTAVANGEGSSEGGTAITITGTGFIDGAVILIDGEECLDVVVVSATIITCTTPAGNVGIVDVAIQNGDGQTAVVTNAFTYLQAPNAPTDLTFVLNGSAATVSFTPGDSFGAQITNYEYSLDGGLTYIALAPADAASPITITGLSDGVTHNILLRAVTSIGASQASVMLTVVVPAAAVDPTGAADPATNDTPTQTPQAPLLPIVAPDPNATPPTPTRIDAGKGPSQPKSSNVWLGLTLLGAALIRNFRARSRIWTSAAS